MRQTTLSATFDVKQESFERLGFLLDALKAKRPHGKFAGFLDTVPVLHFLSLSLFPGHDYDPLFVIEANFDGEPEAFWRQLEAAAGPDLRACLRCCKAPLDENRALFETVTAAENPAPLAPYLKARTLNPSAYHHGNRGLPRERIEKEHKLFLAVRDELEKHEAAYRQKPPPEIHAALREALKPAYPWLTQQEAPRFPRSETVGDAVKLFLFLSFVVFVLSLPGLFLALALEGHAFSHFMLLLAVAAALGLMLSGMIDTPKSAKPKEPFALPWSALALGGAVFFLLYWQLASYLIAFAGVPLTGADWPTALAYSRGWVLASLPSVAVSALGAVVWIRWLERKDSSQDKPPVDPHFLKKMAEREDWVPQNHMGSIVHIKPGVMRTLVIRLGHRALHLVLRLVARNGYLGSMRTIHFAHWAFVNNTSRLMFFSNFDQTWESYLDDFIEKAHGGLTLAWSCGAGFPPTRFLVLDGASAGRQFKEWARHSMAVSHFWYSAYRNLTTDQIERNYRIALKLRQPSLTPKEAAEWLKDL